MTTITVTVLASWILMGGMPAAQAEARPATEAASPQVTLQELVLRDGSRLYGTVEREDEISVVFRTQSGSVVTFERTAIVSVRNVTGSIVKGEFLRRDPNSSRLIFGPTGRALAKGQAYLGVYEFLMPFVQVGLTDRLSIGGGTPLVFGIEDWERPFWITPKLQLLDTGRVQVAAGVFQGFSVDGESGGIAYGVTTMGSESASWTGGAGLAYSGDGGRSAVVMLGGDRQIARSVKVITENYFWKGGDGIVSVGFRFFGEQLSADVGLTVPIGAEDLIMFPIVNFVYSF